MVDMPLIHKVVGRPEGRMIDTDAIAEEAVKFLAEKPAEKPYFLYVPFTAPHWPLHAREETVKSYAGTYDVGWDVIRAKRLERQKALGIIPQETELSPRDARVLAWEDEPEKQWQSRRMEVYAAMVTEMDNAIGKILNQIEDNNEWENTIIIFLSDNGACSEGFTTMVFPAINAGAILDAAKPSSLTLGV